MVDATCCSIDANLVCRLGYHAIIGPKPTILDLVRKGKWTDSGLVIFSRLPVAETRSIRFGAGAALDAGACKGAMWARPVSWRNPLAFTSERVCECL